MHAPRRAAMAALVALVSGCATGAPTPPPTSILPEMVPLVIDTDLATDDLMALGFLLSSPTADIRAVTVSGTGEVRCPAGLAVVGGFLAALDRDDIPVACGRSQPLAGSGAFPDAWRDAADAAWGLSLPQVEVSTGLAATDLLSDAAGSGNVTVLTLGPLTKLAEAFTAAPDLASSLERVVIMGGAVDAGGNVFGEGQDPPVAEWNVYVDPQAAGIVLAAGAPVLLVGLDATNQVPLTPEFVDRFAAEASGREAALVSELLAGNALVESGDAFFWDPLAAAVSLDPDLMETEPVSLTVVTGGSDTGRTVRDPAGDPVDLAVGVDRETFESVFLGAFD